MFANRVLIFIVLSILFSVKFYLIILKASGISIFVNVNFVVLAYDFITRILQSFL